MGPKSRVEGRFKEIKIEIGRGVRKMKSKKVYKWAWMGSRWAHLGSDFVKTTSRTSGWFRKPSLGQTLYLKIKKTNHVKIRIFTVDYVSQALFGVCRWCDMACTTNAVCSSWLHEWCRHADVHSLDGPACWMCLGASSIRNTSCCVKTSIIASLKGHIHL